MFNIVNVCNLYTLYLIKSKIQIWSKLLLKSEDLRSAPFLKRKKKLKKKEIFKLRSFAHEVKTLCSWCNFPK